MKSLVRHADNQSEKDAEFLVLQHKKKELEKQYQQLPKRESFSGWAILDELNKIDEELEELLP